MALNDLKEIVNRARAATGDLDADYAPEAIRLDLSRLQRDWAEACAANFLFREGKKSKVRLLLSPYCKDEPPQDIGRDLVRLQRLAEIVAETERVKPAFAGLERLWRGVDTDIPRLDRMIAWAKDTREAIRAFGTETDDAEWLRQHVVMLLTDYAHLFAPDGATRKAFEALDEGSRLHLGRAGGTRKMRWVS